MTPDLHYQVVDVASIAAGTAEDRYVLPPGLEGEWYLESAVHTPATTQAANGTNYTTWAIKNGATSLGTLSSAVTAFTAATPRAFTLSGGKSREFTALTDPLTINKAESGTGGIGDGSFLLCWRRLS